MNDEQVKEQGQPVEEKTPVGQTTTEPVGESQETGSKATDVQETPSQETGVDSPAPAVEETPPAPPAEPVVSEGQPSVANKAVPATPVVNQVKPTKDSKSKPHSVTTADVKDLKPISASKLTATLEKLKAEGTAAEKSLIASFEEYMTKLAYRRMVTDTEGVNQQRSLFLALRHILNVPSSSEFNRLWSIALAIWNENRGENQPFYSTRRSRFLAAWGWSEDDLQAMLNIHNLMDLTCDPVTRAEGLKRVSLETALRTGFTEFERQRLNNYYQA